MFPIPWYTVLLISIPETVLIIQLGYVLFNLSLAWRETFLASLLIGVTTYFLLRLPIMPGVHTVLLILISSIITSYINKTNFWYSLIAVMCGAMVVGVIENIIISLLLILFSKTANDLVIHPWLNIAVFMPTAVVVSSILLLVKKSKSVLYDLNTGGNPW